MSSRAKWDLSTFLLHLGTHWLFLDIHWLMKRSYCDSFGIVPPAKKITECPFSNYSLPCETSLGGPWQKNWKGLLNIAYIPETSPSVLYSRPHYSQWPNEESSLFYRWANWGWQRLRSHCWDVAEPRHDHVFLTADLMYLAVSLSCLLFHKHLVRTTLGKAQYWVIKSQRWTRYK